MGRMRDGATTDDYRNATGGEGEDEFMSLGYEWSDKPHRLVYDLCGEVDYLKSELHTLQSGEAIVIPRNRDHAEKMLMIAEHWLKKNPK